jgi:hypothetical protein
MTSILLTLAILGGTGCIVAIVVRRARVFRPVDPATGQRGPAIDSGRAAADEMAFEVVEDVVDAVDDLID